MSDVQVVFDHVHLISKDAAAAARWYTDIFGGKITSESEMRGAPQVVVDIHGVRMIVRGKRPGEAPKDKRPLRHFNGFIGHNQWGSDHIGFKVSGDFLGYCSAVRKKGVEFLVEPFELSPGMHIAFIKGPDNETIELVENKAR